MKAITGPTSLWQGIALAAILVLSFFVLEAKRPTNPYYFDEISWICEGRVWVELINGRFNSGVWTEDLVQRLNPQLGKYVLGWWMMRTHQDAGFAVFNCPSWGTLMHVSELDSLTAPQRDVITTMRIPSMWFGIATVGILFLLGCLLFDMKVGVIASLLLVTNPLFQITTNRAMPDSLLLLWFTSFVYCLAVLHIRRPAFLLEINITASALFGVFVGVGTSIKTYGIYAVGLIITIFGSHFVYLLFTKRKKSLKSLLFLISNVGVLLFVLMVTVFILNPVFWYSPFTYKNWIPEWQSFQSWLQHDDWAYKDIALFTPLARLEEIIRSFVVPGYWLTPLVIPFVSALLFVSGLMKTVRRGFSSNPSNSFLFCVVWFSTFLFILLLYTPFRIERYFLPLVPSLVMIQAIAIHHLFHLLTKQITRFHN